MTSQNPQQRGAGERRGPDLGSTLTKVQGDLGHPAGVHRLEGPIAAEAGACSSPYLVFQTQRRGPDGRDHQVWRTDTGEGTIPNPALLHLLAPQPLSEWPPQAWRTAAANHSKPQRVSEKTGTQSSLPQPSPARDALCWQSSHSLDSMSFLGCRAQCLGQSGIEGIANLVWPNPALMPLLPRETSCPTELQQPLDGLSSPLGS